MIGHPCYSQSYCGLCPGDLSALSARGGAQASGSTDPLALPDKLGTTFLSTPPSFQGHAKKQRKINISLFLQ